MNIINFPKIKNMFETKRRLSMFKIENNELFIDKCSTIELAKKYNTPLYVYSENKIIENLNLAGEELPGHATPPWGA